MHFGLGIFKQCYLKVAHWKNKRPYMPTHAIMNTTWQDPLLCVYEYIYIYIHIASHTLYSFNDNHKFHASCSQQSSDHVGNPVRKCNTTHTHTYISTYISVLIHHQLQLFACSLTRHCLNKCCHMNIIFISRLIILLNWKMWNHCNYL